MSASAQNGGGDGGGGAYGVKPRERWRALHGLVTFVGFDRQGALVQSASERASTPRAS